MKRNTHHQVNPYYQPKRTKMRNEKGKTMCYRDPVLYQRRKDAGQKVYEVIIAED